MKPLEGIFVVALEQAVAGPICSMRLADAGARVVKIERPEGDPARLPAGAAEVQSARRRAEEQAAKTATKMVVPLVVFALLPLLFVTLGPALIELFHNLAPAVRR